ncbi:MAG: hypothetical protein AB9828_00030 [Sphaerochaetaceae bacterium]
MTRHSGLLAVLVMLVLVLGVSCLSYSYLEARTIIPAVPSIPEETPLQTHKAGWTGTVPPHLVQSQSDCAVAVPEPGAAPEPVAVADPSPLDGKESSSLLEDGSPSIVLPPVASLSYPYWFLPQEGNMQPMEGPVPQFSVLLIPLPTANGPDDRQDSGRLMDAVAACVDSTPTDFIILTGDCESTAALLEKLGKDGVLFANGSAVITTLPIIGMDGHSLLLEPVPGKTLRLAVANLQDPSPMQTFIDHQSDQSVADTWKTAVQSLHPEREARMAEVLSTLGDTEAVLLGASLAEPSALDWTAFTPIAYRLAYDWPMSLYLGENGFTDSFRATHHSEETDVGNTWTQETKGTVFSERTDYLYSRNIIPMETSLIDLGTLSTASEHPDTSIMALSGSFMLP